MPDVIKIGGVTGWLRAAALPQSHGTPMSIHIFQEISVHLLAITPICDLLECMDLAGPVLTQSMLFGNGRAIALQVPGTGISWTEEAAS